MWQSLSNCSHALQSGYGRCPLRVSHVPKLHFIRDSSNLSHKASLGSLVVLGYIFNSSHQVFLQCGKSWFPSAKIYSDGEYISACVWLTWIQTLKRMVSENNTSQSHFTPRHHLSITFAGVPVLAPLSISLSSRRPCVLKLLLRPPSPEALTLFG